MQAHTHFLPSQREFKSEIHYLVIWFSLATVILILIDPEVSGHVEKLQKPTVLKNHGQGFSASI